MENQVDKKILWVTKNFSSLQSVKTCSNQFLFGGGNCRFLVERKENNDDYLYLYLEVVNYGLWKVSERQTIFSFTIVEQVSQSTTKTNKFSQRLFFKQPEPEPQELRIGNDNNHKVNPKFTHPLGKFKASTYGSSLVNGEVNFVASFGVLHQVVCKLGVPEENREPTNPVKRLKLNDNSAVCTDLKKETMYTNGVQVPTSQMEFVSRLFEKNPDIALVFHSKNPHLRTGYINILLSLTQKLGQSPKELSNDDMSDAGFAMAYMKEAGFKMDWLEKTLEEVQEKKKKEEACLARLHEKEEELKPLKQKCLELEDQVDMEKAELMKIRAPFSFDQYLSS